MDKKEKIKQQLNDFAQKLYPLNRSITGVGVRQTHDEIDEILKTKIDFGDEFFLQTCTKNNENQKNDEKLNKKSLKNTQKQLKFALNRHKIKSGTKVFDWTIPPEWIINDAYIITPDGKKICDFKKHNINVLNYSIAVDKKMPLDELKNHLFCLENQPDVVPYATSYYERKFGFCISKNEKDALKDGIYHAKIDAYHDENGYLDYADFIVNATNDNKDEILISTYTCHPSLANDNLSGIIVATFLIKYLIALREKCGLKYNYRFVFVPETIGAIAYLSKNLNYLKQNVKAGFVLSCVGDENAYSMVPSPSKNSFSDRVLEHILKSKPKFVKSDFRWRGSDERQYNHPLVNLGVATFCRTKFGSFSQYHTNLDNLDFINPDALFDSIFAMSEVIKTLESNEKYIQTTICEPQLGKRNLYRNTNLKSSRPIIADFLAFCDGKNDLISIADILGVKAYNLYESALICLNEGLICKMDNKKNEQ